MNFFRKYQAHILFSILAFFLVSIFFSFGSSFFAKGAPNDPIVEVDGEKIPLHLFYSRYNRALEQVKPGTTLDQNARADKRNETVRDLIQGLVFSHQAKKYGIVVPDQQVINSLAQIPAFQEKGAFSPELYGRALAYQLKSTPEEFEEEQRTSIAFFKIRYLIQSCIKVTDKEMVLQRAYAASIHSPDAKKSDAEFRDQLWQEKVVFLFNQWFQQIGQRTHIKTHLELIEGVAK